jgi:DNA-binding CsgD family transcriptional regulator
MQDLDFSPRDLAALRSLMAMEPVPGQPLPDAAVLEKVHVLVPCDELNIGYVDMTGLVTAGVRLSPARHRNTMVIDLDLHEQHGGPFYLGVMHWRLHPALAEGCGNFLGRREDALSIGFRNGTDHVVQYSFRRARKHFTARELAILGLVSPALQRMARERPTPRLPASLTITERRILCDVAAGFSNAEIAEDYSVAVSTVRKHLENTYRKLGVSNRMAAIARLRGSDEPGLDLQERVERFA